MYFCIAHARVFRFIEIETSPDANYRGGADKGEKCATFRCAPPAISRISGVKSVRWALRAGEPAIRAVNDAYSLKGTTDRKNKRLSSGMYPLFFRPTQWGRWNTRRTVESPLLMHARAERYEFVLYSCPEKVKTRATCAGQYISRESRRRQQVPSDNHAFTTIPVRYFKVCN